jgi:hypothetical protein
MTQASMATLITVGVVLVVDLLTTQLRRQAWRMTVSLEPRPDGEEPHGSHDGTVPVKTE